MYKSQCGREVRVVIVADDEECDDCAVAAPDHVLVVLPELEPEFTPSHPQLVPASIWKRDPQPPAGVWV